MYERSPTMFLLHDRGRPFEVITDVELYPFKGKKKFFTCRHADTPGYAVGCVVVDSAEKKAQVFRLNVEPDVFQEKPELGAGEEAAPFRVVLVENRLRDQR